MHSLGWAVGLTRLSGCANIFADFGRIEDKKRIDGEDFIAKLAAGARPFYFVRHF